MRQNETKRCTEFKRGKTKIYQEQIDIKRFEFKKVTGVFPRIFVFMPVRLSAACDLIVTLQIPQL